MTEYIERDAAKAVLNERYKIRTHMHDLNSAAQLKNAELEIGDIPAADVRPVVRGKWETVMLDHERMGCRPTAHYCSECHQITWFRTFYCPNCGADMREG